MARTSPRWRFLHIDGPLPWLTAEDLAVLRENSQTDSEYRQLHLNEWVASEDRLASREDLAACTTLPGPLPPRPGVRYVITADLGLVNDRTVVAVMHAEDGPVGRKTILDSITRWQGTRADPVPLAEVRDTVGELSAQYNRAGVVVDPHQAALLAQELRGEGVEVQEFVFSSTSIGRLALSLHQAIRQHRLDLPDDEDLLDELGSVRLRKNTLGVYRLDHDAAGHDDQAVTLALGVHCLTDLDPVPQFIVFGDEDAQAGELNRWGAEVLKQAGVFARRRDLTDDLFEHDDDDHVDRGRVQISPFV